MNPQMVYIASLDGEMGSFGNAENKLFTQRNYPFIYDNDIDVILSADSDRCRMWDNDHNEKVYKQHGVTQLSVGQWSQRSSKKKIMDFLIDVLKADKEINWTGYRISVTVNRSNGYPVYHFSLFSKGKDSDTIVYFRFAWRSECYFYPFAGSSNEWAIP